MQLVPFTSTGGGGATFSTTAGADEDESIVHGLDTLTPSVVCWRTATSRRVEVDWRVLDADTIELNFDSAPGAGSITVSVKE